MAATATISGDFYDDRIFGGAGRDSIDADRSLDHVNVADGRSTRLATAPARMHLAEQSVEGFVRLSSSENVTVR